MTLSRIKIGGGEAAKRRPIPPVGNWVGAAPGTPTLVVAANDALTSSKNRADYECDGTDDQAEINSAIAALPSIGGRIVLTEGTFNISSTISLPSSDHIRFTGMGGSVLSFANDQGIRGAASGRYIFDGIKFTRPSGAGSGLLVGGSGAPSTASFWFIHNCWFHDIEADYVMGVKGVGHYGKWIVTNNRFTTIDLNKGGVNVNVSAVLIADEGGSRDAWGVFNDNYLDGITKTSFAGNSHYVIYAQTDSAFMASGNFIINSSTVTTFGGQVHSAHNMIELADAPGEHNLVSAPGIDSTAIHDNVSSEISAITEKATLASGDLVVIEDSAASNAKKKAQIGNVRLLGDGSELTIAAGSVTATSGYHIIDTEGDAASDNLDNIAGGSAGQLLIIRSAQSTRDVVCRDEIGNLRLATTDFTLTNSEDTLTLIHDGAAWCEVSRSNNTAVVDLIGDTMIAVADGVFGSHQLNQAAGTGQTVASNSASLSVA